MRHFPLRELGYAIGFVLLLVAIYVGSYYAMVVRVDWRMNTTCWVEYRFGGEWADRFFSPMHDLDRRFRPEWWEREVIVSGQGF